MKPILILLYLVVIPFWGGTQSKPTFGQIVDFTIGDEFEFKVQSQPPNIKRIKVTEKSFSVALDTVFYTFLKSGYVSEVDYSTSPPHLKYSFYQNTIEKVFYTRLSDTLSESAPPASELDSCNTYKDTTFFSSDYCNSPSFLSTTCKHCCFEGEITKLTYSVGLGCTVYEYNYPAEGVIKKEYLTFYKKGIDSCGSSDKTNSIFEIDQSILKPLLFPNPTTGLFTVRNIDGDYTIELINTIGEVVCHVEKTNESTLNIEQLEKGIYLVKLVSKNAVFNQKIFLK